MIENLIHFTCVHAQLAPWILAVMILLGGLCVPISLDLMLMLGGAITVGCLEGQILKMYPILFVASCLAAWEAYWLGRTLGPRLYRVKMFQAMISPERTRRLHDYYEKFGLWTFVVVRFIPGGVRSALFLTSGLGKMPFTVFIYRDFIGALISTVPIFYMGMYFGENHVAIFHFIRTYELGFMGAFLFCIGCYIAVVKYRAYCKKRCD